MAQLRCSMTDTPEESRSSTIRLANSNQSLPLTIGLANDSNGPKVNNASRGETFVLGASAAYLMQVAVVCLPPVVRFWHPTFYATLGPEEQRGWTWLGANSLWLALVLIWTLRHLDHGPCVARACLLCSLLWASLLAVLVSQWRRGQLPLSAIADLVVYVVMLGASLRTEWYGVAQEPREVRLDGGATWRRGLRNWALVSACLLLLSAFIACWARGLPLAPPASEKESAPWEWNSAVLFVMMLGVLWAALVTRGDLVEETKRAACAWCALVFSFSFVLCSFSWPALGLNGHNIFTSVILVGETVMLVFAAVR